MNQPAGVNPSLKEQLQALRIPRDQRPAGGRGGARAEGPAAPVAPRSAPRLSPSDAPRSSEEGAAAPRPSTPAARPRAARRGGSWLGGLFRSAVLLGLGGGAFWAYGQYGAALEERLGVDLPGVSGAVEVQALTVAAQLPPQPGPVLTATGKIDSDHQVQVATKVSGQIVELLFEQGDAVEQGQLLARLEDTNYRALRDQAAAMLEKAQASEQFQGVRFAWRQRLFNEQRSSEMEFSEARRDRDEARAQVLASRAALEFAEKALSDTSVVAPIDGVVLQRNVEVGDFVAAEGGRGANANAQFAVIADMSKLRVEVDVSELDIARLRSGMPCIVTPDAYKDRRYWGHVMWIDPGANYAKATVQVKVRIEEPDALLRVEGSAQVQFMTDPPDPAALAAKPTIWIPLAAVRERGTDGATVLLIEQDRAVEQVVTLGERREAQVQVVSGLQAGATIVAQIPSDLTSGTRVRVRE